VRVTILPAATSGRRASYAALSPVDAK